MRESMKDQLEGKLHELKGAVKAKAGDVLNKPDLKKEGLVEQLAGKFQSKAGQIEKVLDK